ncbi:MAG TPA: MFS transporter [Stellaceae bacterium]|nr:MFS transporter [Stellaceae bacterium]
MSNTTAKFVDELGGADDAAQQSKVFTKVAWRVLPILVLAYLFNYVDRTNISVAALQMNKAVGLTASEFGYGAGLLFIGYCLFEIPSNFALYRFGARIWIARIMITWGLVSAAMAFCSGPYSYYALRFLLGVAEAGFFPGVAFYLSYWFPSGYRARVLAWFLVSIPASSFIGAPVAGLLLKMDGIWGLAGWQWLFLMESLPCVLIGLVLPRLLPNQPHEAPWLSEQEREIATRTLTTEEEALRRKPKVVNNFVPALFSGRVWLLGLIYLSFSTGSYGVQVWLPIIIKGGHFSNTMVSLLVAIPYLFSVAAMIFGAWYVDRYGKRVLNVILTCAVASGGFIFALMSHDLVAVLSSITLALLCLNAARAIFWAIPSLYLTGGAAAGGLALISSIGTLGGFIGPSVMGWLKDATGSFTAGLLAMAGFLALASVLAIVLNLTSRVGRTA